MIQHTIRLIDVLSPPMNRWLSEISRRRTNLPVGVRVIRFGDESDDGLDKPEQAGAVARPRSK